MTIFLKKKINIKSHFFLIREMQSYSRSAIDTVTIRPNIYISFIADKILRCLIFYLIVYPLASKGIINSIFQIMKIKA